MSTDSKRKKTCIEKPTDVDEATRGVETPPFKMKDLSKAKAKWKPYCHCQHESFLPHSLKALEEGGEWKILQVNHNVETIVGEYPLGGCT